MTAQHRADGSLRHLLTLEGLPREQIESLLERSQHYARVLGEPAPRDAALAGITVANLFTEPSTRTRVSFELAAKRLGAEVVNLEVQLSSRAKGESMLDTVFTLESLHVDVFVIRDAEAGVPALVAEHVAPHVSVLSAGEAHLSHPTQGLLDALTVLQSRGRFDGLAVAIVGDIRHSRVARSAAHVMQTLGVRELRIVAPPALMPEEREFAGCRRFTRLEEGLREADVVMMLRIQRERFANADVPAGDDYFHEYGLTSARLALARPDAIVMHPQPMNRGVEIASDVADGPRSVIRRQVSNGVAVRMAVLETIVSGRQARESRQLSVAKPHRDTIFVETATVLSQQTFAGKQYVLRLQAPRCAARATAGSFAHVAVDPAIPMRRPLSIMRADPQGGWIELLYKVMGEGLSHLATRKAGDAVSLIGPIGQGFTLSPSRPRALLIGGGVGIPPMIFLAEDIRAREAEGFKALAILGSELPFPFRARPSTIIVPGMPDGVIASMPLLEEWGIASRLTSKSGFPGCHDGYVTDLARLWLARLDAQTRSEVEIFACGPTPMLKAVAALAAEFGVACQVSLEEFMACAVGGCAGCVVEVTTPAGKAMKRVCVDGPVFDATTVFAAGHAL